MNKYVFTIFLLISPILLCGQNILNVFVGDTIVFSGLDGTRDCFFDMSSLEKYNFSNKNKFEVENGSTSYHSVENCWLRVDSIISYKKDILVVFDRIKDGQKFLMKLPPIKKVPESSFLQNHIKCYETQESTKHISNYYYDLSCEKKSYYDNLILELTKAPLLPVTGNVFNAFDRYVLKSYLIEQVPIKVRFEINGTSEVELSDYEINQLITEKKGKEARIALFNNYMNRFDIEYFKGLNTRLSGNNYWLNTLILSSQYHKIEDGPESIHYKYYKYTTSKHEVFFGDSDYKTFETAERLGIISYCCDWPSRGTKEISGEVAGGSVWRFLRGKVIGIDVLPTLVSQYRLSNYSNKTRAKRAILDQWGDYNYYIIIVPDPTMTYKISSTNCDSVFGRDLIDTLFVPYSIDKLSCIFTDEQMDSLETAYNQSLQKSWAKSSAEYEKRYKTAVRLFGKKNADIICSGEVRLGFTSEMCSFAYEGEPYHESYETTPIGTFLCRDYYSSGVKLYFKNNRLALIQWIDDY